jgi:hypothetical protein
MKMESEVYESHKKVLRCSINRADYNKYRVWLLPEDENGEDEGYLVEYLDGGVPNHPLHKGYISWSPKKQFDDGYSVVTKSYDKSFGNTDQDGCRKNVSDVVIFGEDLFKLLSKASSAKEGWMKSTKAMDTGNGCVVQVTTQQKKPGGSYSCAESVTFVPNTCINEHKDKNGIVTKRWLASYS